MVTRKMITRQAASTTGTPGATAESTAAGKRSARLIKPSRPATKASTKAVTKTGPEAAPAPVAAPVKKTASKPIKPTKASKADKPAKAVKLEKAPKTPKAPKEKLDKLVRDSFTMPESDFKLIASVKQRAIGFGRATKKSEVLRAGLKALQGMSEPQLRALLETLPVIKTGRPKKSD